MQKSRAHRIRLAPLGELAQLYQANGFTPEAVRALETLRRLEPAEPRWAYLLADLRLKDREPAAARELLIETVHAAPDYVPARLLLAEMLVEQKRVAEAAIHFERAHVLAADDPRPEVGLAFFDAHCGRLTAALQRLRAVVERHPHYAPVHNLMALLLDRTGDAAGAAEHRRLEAGSVNRNFTASDPWTEELGEYCYDANRLHMLAFAHSMAKRDAAAVPILLRATRLAPTEAALYDSLAGAYEASGRPDEARAALETGIRQAPHAFELHIRLAVILTGQQKSEEAIAVVERALARWPEQAELHAARGHVLLLAGRPAEATEAFQAALARNRTLTEAHLNLGRAWARLGRVDEAKASFERAATLRPDYVDALIELISLARLQGDLAATRQHADRLLNAYPDRADVRRACAEAYLFTANRLAGANRMAEAEQAYQRGIEADPKVSLLHAGLGMVCAATDRLRDAIPHLERYVQTAPEDPGAYLMLGNVLRDAGQSAAARDVITKGLAIARQAGATAQVEALERWLQP